MNDLDPAVRVVRCLRRFAFHPGSEHDLQTGVAIAFRDGGIAHDREAKLSPQDRVDFLTESGVAVELKTTGAVWEVMRQLQRYASSERVEAVVLVTTAAKHLQLPAAVLSKPLHVVLVGGIA